MRHLVTMGGAALTMALLAGCGSGSGTQSLTTTTNSASVAVGGGRAQTFVTTTRSGAPVEVGIQLDSRVLGGLNTNPTAPEEAHRIAIPATAGLPFDHVSVDWNPAGHPPPGIYDLPHFDMHFYLLTNAEQDAIEGANLNAAAAAPAAAEVPAGYTQIPGVVPEMGVHWFDPTSPEWHGQTFTRTLIYGFDYGHMAFVEPMVTRAFLASGQNVTASIPQPTVYPKPGYYPTSYSIRHQPDGSIQVVLSGFVQRQ